ncbi:MAG: hypothetical protein SAJ12_18335 [Jaaginema sp. PMC 1079.18]|nr:hypothetical protein [Jaaginema sp. PMC 1080.18]MEC4852944.1 hypothetical protein [Jaaginema sp. PMC 1079.18]MEC4868443.1 hypothetical protein [Jaaginema sp. PMC 1078.18]
MKNHFPTFLNKFSRLTALTLVPAGLLAISCPQAAKADWNPFEICAEELLATEAISPEQVAIACAEALEPKDLSYCVIKINTFTPVDAVSALQACFRDRRPLELATCTVNITKEFDRSDRIARQSDDILIAQAVDTTEETPGLTPESPEMFKPAVPNIINSNPGYSIPDVLRSVDNINSTALATLEYCRVSLLPTRYSECVIGLSRQVDFTVGRLLETCIEAETFPPSLFPSVGG